MNEKGDRKAGKTTPTRSTDKNGSNSNSSPVISKLVKEDFRDILIVFLSIIGFCGGLLVINYLVGLGL